MAAAMNSRLRRLSKSRVWNRARNRATMTLGLLRVGRFGIRCSVKIRGGLTRFISPALRSLYAWDPPPSHFGFSGALRVALLFQHRFSRRTVRCKYDRLEQPPRFSGISFSRQLASARFCATAHRAACAASVASRAARCISAYPASRRRKPASSPASNSAPARTYSRPAE